jgi:RHH-type proline utilization regulon transcriptional repressor/proline dehydrogenase/delta 1-pyrroline-5-carboxylate dehydrogenase
MHSLFDSAPHLVKLAALYRADEEECLKRLIPQAQLEPSAKCRIGHRATAWVEEIRRNHKPSATVTDLLARFGLTSQEGLALMCLAEALLRIPDRATADALIRDKLDEAHWHKAFASDAPWSINMTGWALSLTGKIIHLDHETSKSAGAVLGRLVSRLGQPVIREAIKAAMQWMADQFVIGQTIEDALHRTTPFMREGVRFSFDMLGEGARTAEDAARYLTDYERAVDAVGAHQQTHKFARPSGISVKLSALHPRYEMAQRARVMTELVPRLVALCERAALRGMTLTIDAEEGDRLQLSLEVIVEVMARMKTGSWQGFGMAVQAYDKRTPATIDMIAAMAAAQNGGKGRRIHVRLVKGAYWDTEIKRGQERGWDDFSVYTRKVNTDVAYMACARRLLAHPDFIDPVFGTHNALTVAHICELAGDTGRVEFQRLHGMGNALHDLMRRDGLHDCIYAPVGSHDVLLGYLVRRILENGANSSFVHRLLDPSVSVAELTADPIEQCLANDGMRHPAVRRAADLFTPDRRNSAGLDLADPFVTEHLLAEIARFRMPVPAGIAPDIDTVFAWARDGFLHWSAQAVEVRAACLERLGDALEKNTAALMSLMIREGGKCIPDALGEVREAVDFCRYYAVRARADFAPIPLPGPTGERNTMQLVGRGVFVCISPWNFPLAIFLGQVLAALAAGNAVIAKPAPQTPQIARFTAQLAYDCGIPRDAFHVVTGGADTGALIIAHPMVAGVAFTGSTNAARAINRALAAKDGPIVPLIAETGGQNALIVDNSALPEQVVDDVLASSFRSAGQRCSALRILCLPEETADKIIAMLKGAMRELSVGDPGKLSTDVGPVIDAQAKEKLLAHVTRLRAGAKEIYTAGMGNGGAANFVAPQAWEIPSIAFLTDEVFGPILHIVRYRTENLGALIAQINATGFGLTGGLHSRIEHMVRRVERDLHVGNFYVNRSLIGAVVGVQPFGGEGLSGTGPKAGGPHYLLRFAAERVTSVNTTAAGGNASLLMAASA